MKSLLTLILIFFITSLLFSYRLLEVPKGITVDEAAFGYNAALISQTLRDENGRFLPVFILSLDGRDWRQPIAQYLMVGSLKVFGRSVFNLKLISVLTISLSAVLIFLIGKFVYGFKFGLITLILFVTAPVIMIHSHLALDNITPLPFILLWILGLLLYERKRSLWLLIIAGISLGLSFYAHKSMRSAVPIWTVLTVFYLYLPAKKFFKIDKTKLRTILIFVASILPFYLVAPFLDYKYAGAVFGSQDLSIKSIYDYVYFYISSFDISFLFIKGDSIMHHSTGKHGMMLLSTLPLIFLGIYKSIADRNKLMVFLTVCFLTGPLLMGFIGSVHRASRMIFLIPLFSLISAYGLYWFWQLKSKVSKVIFTIFVLIFMINFYDFINYYWFKYAEDTYHIFYRPTGINAYKKLAEVSRKENLNPLISQELLKTGGDGGAVEDFSRSLYFINPQNFNEKDKLPANSILLSTNSNLFQYEKLDTGVKNYFLYKVK